MTDDLAIEVRDLRISYGEVEAVGGIGFSVRRGEVFAVLGPNGAGKTTTIEHLEGFRRRDGGEARVLGEDPETAGTAWRGRLGVVLQESSVEAELTVREVVTLYAGYHARPLGVEEALGLAGLSDLGDRRGGRLSGGQQRRVDVALALVGDPELIFLDEPTTGFDPQARRTAWETIEGLRGLGKTIVLTTHYLEEAERLADRIAVIAAGRIVAEGTPATLGERDRAGSRISFTPPPGAQVPGDWTAEGAQLVTSTPEPLRVLAELSAWGLAHGADLRDLQVRPPSLEDVYLRLVREPAT
ncbi:MAG: ABC transporter ATP-binding protein [Solirubrobacteraceae bacterium]